MDSVPGRGDADVVIADGEGVDPALQSVADIPVEDHVLREFIEYHPFVRRDLKGFVHICLQDFLSLVQ